MALLKLIPVGQAYATEQDANVAVDSLRAQNFEEDDISIITPSMVEPMNSWMLTKDSKDGVDSTEMLAQVIIKVHEASAVPDSHAMVYADNIQQGRSIVLVTAPFGQAGQATDILNSSNPVDIGELPELEYHTWMQPAPLSALLNMPVLSHRRSWMSRTFAELTEPGYLPTAGIMGGLLSDKPTPLSTAAGLDVLTENPTPLSSKFGLEVLTDNPTPLSSKLGLKLLTNRRPTGQNYSFGLPLLSKNPTPLSSLFGIPVLKHDD